MSDGHDHDHSVEHGHGHGHGHGHLDENPDAGQGAVVLDIGGTVGALVVVMPAAMVGEEVEILAHRLPADQPRAHVAVVERPGADGPVPTLVYPQLEEGGYDLVLKGTDDVRLTVQVEGGAVTEVDWA